MYLFCLSPEMKISPLNYRRYLELMLYSHMWSKLMDLCVPINKTLHPLTNLYLPINKTTPFLSTKWCLCHCQNCASPSTKLCFPAFKTMLPVDKWILPRWPNQKNRQNDASTTYKKVSSPMTKERSCQQNSVNKTTTIQLLSTKQCNKIPIDKTKPTRQQTKSTSTSIKQ